MKLTLPDDLIERLMPAFGQSEQQEIVKFYSVYQQHQDELSAKIRAEMLNYPTFAALLSNTPEQKLKHDQQQSIAFRERAILHQEWKSYVHYLVEQGIIYAQLGLDFKSWMDLFGIARKYLWPLIEQAYKGSADLSLALKGMNHFFEFGISVIGEAYVYEKKRIIEEQKKQQERLIKQLESFAYIISHDLKTPLRGIGNLSDWIIEDYKDKLDDTGKDYLALLKNRVNRLEALVDGVLEYSRSDSSQAEITELNLVDILDEVKEMLMPPPNVTIRTGELPRVKFSKNALIQVLSNLIDNAIKYNDKPQKEIDINVVPHGLYWKISVQDNGPGISPQYHEKVFQIFQTLQSKDSIDSTGVGLSIVKKVIESAGGTVWIESEEDRGSTFCFTLKKI